MALPVVANQHMAPFPIQEVSSVVHVLNTQYSIESEYELGPRYLILFHRWKGRGQTGKSVIGIKASYLGLIYIRVKGRILEVVSQGWC